MTFDSNAAGNSVIPKSSSPFTNPRIAAIDDAMTGLEPILEEFALAHGFILSRSHEGSFNVPRRWMHRTFKGVRHEIGLIISSGMPERLERGFYPNIPCSLYISAWDLKVQKHYYAAVFEALPFRLIGESLHLYLADAIARLDACTTEFITLNGIADLVV